MGNEHLASDPAAHHELIRFMARQELRTEDPVRMLAVLTALQLTPAKIEAYTVEWMRRKGLRRMVLTLDGVDEMWIAYAIAAVERRGPEVGRGSPCPNAQALATICLEWMGMMRRGQGQ
jgi:hypothetical protein